MASILCLPSASTQPQVKAESAQVQVILMAGQSNMAGAGNFDALDPKTKARLRQLGDQITIVTKRQSIQATNKQLFTESKYHLKKYGFERTFGPELAMLLTLTATHPEQRYLVIKTAYGGTSLHGAWNPNWSQDKAQAAEQGAYKQSLKLFAEHIQQIQQTLAYLTQQGTNYRLLGLGWLQGENDTNSALKAMHYKQNLQNLVAAYRTQLAQPELKVVVAQINMQAKKYPEGTNLVRTAQQQAADADPFIRLLPTSLDPSWIDYPKHFDNVHYNTKGQINMGKTFASAFLSF
ncbi:sialate O-acetylesterase [Paraglaciecola aquimarina]|uniref:Sialate O-acetylesterase n=1 Tax=Paraglaciecola aquimarina TaxID=1235557 RepID=A0ABU3SVF8_9ALTE|nr:sialate O-acetylesterase [Paraglaciecola aquimarina]MDU0354001.1 sialate O-acetylesterase [Paraglaciecola aquimarina]